MKAYASKSKEKEKQSAAHAPAQSQHGNDSSHQLVDMRPEAKQMRKLQEVTDNGPQVTQLRAIQEVEANRPIQPVSKRHVAQMASVWDEVDVGFGQKTKLSPEAFAQDLTEESEEFAELRDAANKQTREHFRKDLSYKPKPKKGGGTSEAYFKDDATYFNMEGHPAMILSNLIFETANAAQSGSFIQVESDYKTGEIMNKTPKDYGFEDLGEKLTKQYEIGDAEERRSIIQERFEWRSFVLAKPSFLKVKAEMQKKDKSKEMYSVYFATFDHMLSMNSFEEYYNEYGYMHKKSVEGVLRRVAEQEKAKSSCCYLTTACVEARGLPDDCEELTILREFRDTYLMNKENGNSLIAAYYKYSPQIVCAIKKRRDEDEILAWIYGVICRCVEAIKRDDNEFAYRTYCRMVVELKDIYIPEVD